MAEKHKNFHLSDNNLSSPPKMMIKSFQKKGWKSDPTDIESTATTGHHRSRTTDEYTHYKYPTKNSLIINSSDDLVKKRTTLKKKRTFSNFKENNSWNSQLERITKDIGEKADGIKWMHDHDSGVLTLLDNILGILTIVFGVLAIIPSALMGLDRYKDIQLVFLINIALTVITALFAGLKQFLPLQDMSDKHKSAAGRYLQLRNLVKLQLALYRKDRENGKTFVATLQREFNVLFATSPSITTWTSWRFGIKFKNVEMTKPDAIDGITPIDVRQTTKESNSTESNDTNKDHDKYHDADKDHDTDDSFGIIDQQFIDLEKGEVRSISNYSNHSNHLSNYSNHLPNTQSSDSSKSSSPRSKPEYKGSKIKKNSPKTNVQTTQFSAYNVEKSENEESDDEPDRYITQADKRQRYEFERFLKSSN